MRKMRDAVKSKMAQALSDFRNMQQLEDALEQAQVYQQHICTFFGSACMLINDIPAQSPSACVDSMQHIYIGKTHLEIAEACSARLSSFNFHGVPHVTIAASQPVGQRHDSMGC